ncbi:hypothetical protein ZWY2020_051371 [Hordeum vulgare]|nr:hypothetical protein ZWY2020_051371 [Hordeum vulgare]
MEFGDFASSPNSSLASGSLPSNPFAASSANPAAPSATAIDPINIRNHVMFRIPLPTLRCPTERYRLAIAAAAVRRRRRSPTLRCPTERYRLARTRSHNQGRRTAPPGSAGEEDEEMYDDDRSSDASDYSYDDDDDSGESGWYYEDREEEEEQEGAGGDRACGSAEEEAASAGVGGGPKAEGSAQGAVTCCICMDPWAPYGAHRICCIPCGHVYGRSCLERWLLGCGNVSAKCPTCSERFKHMHIINLYSPVHLWNDCCLKEVAISLLLGLLLYQFCSMKNDLLVTNCRLDTKSYVVEYSIYGS